MTPKEKAEELFNRYHYIEMDLDENLFCDSCDYNRKLSKYCALIAVDEILNNGFHFTDESEYWLEVKKEIEEL